MADLRPQASIDDDSSKSLSVSEINQLGPMSLLHYSDTKMRLLTGYMPRASLFDKSGAKQAKGALKGSFRKSTNVNVFPKNQSLEFGRNRNLSADQKSMSDVSLSVCTVQESLPALGTVSKKEKEKKTSRLRRRKGGDGEVGTSRANGGYGSGDGLIYQWDEKVPWSEWAEKEPAAVNWLKMEKERDRLHHRLTVPRLTESADKADVSETKAKVARDKVLHSSSTTSSLLSTGMSVPVQFPPLSKSIQNVSKTEFSKTEPSQSNGTLALTDDVLRANSRTIQYSLSSSRLPSRNL